MAKAQTALEFIIMIGIVLVIGTVFLFSVMNVVAEAAEIERTAALNEVGYMIQDEIILATLVEDGYRRTFAVPQLAGRFTYSLAGTTSSVTLSSGTVKITYDIPPISGAVNKGNNLVEKTGTVTVS